MKSETLLLSEKGSLRPAPILSGFAQSVSESVSKWPGVIAATHWHISRHEEVNGADFYVGEWELGHIHLDGEVHLATSIELRTLLIASGYARPFPWYESWVETSIRTEIEASRALWLFELNYCRLKGMDFPELRERVKNYIL